MKLSVFSLNSSLVKDYKHLIKKNFSYDDKHPEMVVSLGGDGTFLMAERRYPGIPKLLVRDSNICNKCDWSSLSPILDKLRRNEFAIEEHMKLEADVRGDKKLCLNDAVIRNKMPIHAIRFILSVDGKQVNGELIGDGVVVATPFGSTAYYYSITKKMFNEGIGIALNNLSMPVENIITGENSLIEIKLTRGDATFSYDNDENIITLKTGDKVVIKKSGEVARIVKIK